MDDQVRRLRSRLEALSRGRAPPGVRYPAELRTEVVELAREAYGAGIGASAGAKQLGLPPGTITRWGRDVPRRRLRIGNTNDLRQRSLRPWVPSP